MDNDSAQKLHLALEKMQVASHVTKLQNARGCQTAKKKLFQDADAELTLKLLKITPKTNELQVQRTDSEFLKDYNSTAKQQSAASHHIISTEGSDDHDSPSLEQAYKLVAMDQVAQSDVGITLQQANTSASGNVPKSGSQVAELTSYMPFDHSAYLDSQI